MTALDDREQAREDDINLIYQTQAALALLAEMMARDRCARLPERPLAYMTLLEHELSERMPSGRRH